MCRRLKKLTIFFVTTIVSAQAFAEVEIGKVTIGGSGCNQDNSAVFIDNNYIVVAFQDYKLETSENNTLARKSCDFSMSLSLPPNQQVKLETVLMFGSAAIAKDAEAKFAFESFFTGSVEQVYTNTINGEYLDVVSLWQDLEHPWSECGALTILRMNTSVRILGKNSFVALSSLSGNIKFRYKLRSC